MRAGCGHVAKPCGHGVASGMSTRYGGNSVAPAAGSWQRHRAVVGDAGCVVSPV